MMFNREIIFDTETTGFGVEEHRILEIGAVELVNRLPTGRTFHTYLNPEREIDFGAQKVHGITAEKVADAPKFADMMHQWMDFVAEAPLIAHNAAFDMAFINMELGRHGHPGYPAERFIDTLEVARRKLPGQRHSLDALCRFYNIDNSARTYHGALLDAQLLAEVYIELTGGLQGALVLEETAAIPITVETATTPITTSSTPTLIIHATEEEKARHTTFLEKMIKNPRWLT